jgi:hypothetical protein
MVNTVFLLNGEFFEEKEVHEKLDEVFFGLNFLYGELWVVEDDFLDDFEFDEFHGSAGVSFSVKKFFEKNVMRQFGVHEENRFVGQGILLFLWIVL